jgi:hypothetical protein
MLLCRVKLVTKHFKAVQLQLEVLLLPSPQMALNLLMLQNHLMLNHQMPSQLMLPNHLMPSHQMLQNHLMPNQLMLPSHQMVLNQLMLPRIANCQFVVQFLAKWSKRNQRKQCKLVDQQTSIND